MNNFPSARNLFTICFLFLTMVFSALVYTHAGVPPPDEELPPITEQEHVTIVEMDKIERIITKTGTKIGGLDLFHSPMSLTIITRQQLHNSGARNLSEALEIFVPGFQYMVNKWSGNVWGLRGVSSDYNDKFVFLINGIKQNFQSRDGAIAEVMLACMDDIDRIEMLSGPAGLTYGSGAIAGVVNIVTRRTSTTTSENTLQMGSVGNSAKDVQFDKQFFLELSKMSSLAISVGCFLSRGIGEERGRIFGYPSYTSPDTSDGIPRYPTGSVPVNGSAGKTPGNWRASLNYEYKNFRLYSRYTRQVQQASGWFVLDPWPEITDHDLITDTVVSIDGVEIHKPVDSLSATQSLWKYWTSTEGSGFNRWQYCTDNLLLGLSQQIPVGEDALEMNADITTAADNVELEQLDDYFDPSKEKKNEAFGEMRYGFDMTYLLKRVKNFYTALGADVHIDNIGNDPFRSKNSKNGTDAHVIEPVRFTNLAGFFELYYDILGREKVAFHCGGRFDLRHNTSDLENASRDFAHKWEGDFAPKVSFIITPNRRNSFKLFYHKSSNFGSADIYMRNFYFTKEDGSPYTQDHFETPDVQPTPTTDILVSWNFVRDSVLNSIKKEETHSVELATSHRILDERLYIGTSLSYNYYKNLLLWCQEVFRRINMGNYQTVNGVLDLGFHNKKRSLVVGVNHSTQYLLNTDQEAGTRFQRHKYSVPDTNHTIWIKVFNSNTQDSIFVPNDTFLKTDWDTIRGVQSQITRNGTNFLNMSSNITKLYVDVTPSSRWGFHVDARIFWAALKGRTSIHQNDPVNKIQPGAHDYLDIETSPLIKLNAGVHATLFENRTIGPRKTFFKSVAISLCAYDILGLDYGHGDFFVRNSIRWQQMSFVKDRDLYSVDLLSLALRMNVDF